MPDIATIKISDRQRFLLEHAAKHPIRGFPTACGAWRITRHTSYARTWDRDPSEAEIQAMVKLGVLSMEVDPHHDITNTLTGEVSHGRLAAITPLGHELL